MKRVYFYLLTMMFAAGAGLFVWSCDDAAEYQEVSTLKYLTVAESEAKVYSDKDLKVIGEAIHRLDPYVVFKNGQYMLEGVRPSDIAMSRQLYLKLTETMRMTNEFLREKEVVEVSPNVVRLVSDSDPLIGVSLKGLGEDAFPLNSDGYDFRWYGFDMYFSTGTIAAIKKSGNVYAETQRAQGDLPSEILATIVESATNYFSLANVACSSGLIIVVWWLGGPMSAHCQ